MNKSLDRGKVVPVLNEVPSH